METLYLFHNCMYVEGPEHDSIFENHGAVIGDGLKPKKVAIATIDEITKDPDLQILANGS